MVTKAHKPAITFMSNTWGGCLIKQWNYQEKLGAPKPDISLRRTSTNLQCRSVQRKCGLEKYNYTTYYYQCEWKCFLTSCRIEAAIVRIMKARKKRPHNLLVAEVSILPDYKLSKHQFFSFDCEGARSMNQPQVCLFFHYYQLKTLQSPLSRTDTV